MSDRPIHDALESLWDELIEDDKYEMKEVLLTPEQQRALHMEMQHIAQEQHYWYENGHWKWRDMPIMRPDQMTTGYSRHASLGEGQPMPGISCKAHP